MNLTEMKLKIIQVLKDKANDESIIESTKKDIIHLINAQTMLPLFYQAFKDLEQENEVQTIRKGHALQKFIWKLPNLKIEENTKDIKTMEDNLEILENIDVNDYITDSFNNIQMRLYKTDKGYAVPIIDICSALNASRQSIHQLLERNIDLFKNWLVNVTLTSSESGINTCLTRDGIVGILMKVSYNRLSEEKKKLVLDFQKWAIEKLSLLISDGKVELSEQEHTKVKTQFQEIIELSDEELDKMMEDLKLRVDAQLEKVMQKVDEKNKIIRIAEYEKKKAVAREQAAMARVPQLVEQRVDRILARM